MSVKPTKIGMIGGGRWGQNLIKTLYELGTLAAVAEMNQDTITTLQKQYPDIPFTRAYEDILSSEISAVVIATPVATHFHIAQAALLAGKDVFVEKPLTMRADEAQQLVALAKQYNRILMVGHMLLYQPAIQFIKNFLDQGQLGKIYSLYQVRRNLGTVRLHENALYSLGVHDLAVLDYLVNKSIVSVLATGQQIITENIEDDVTVHLNYANGVAAHLHVSWLWPEKERRLVINGEKGSLCYDELSQTVIWHKSHANQDATLTQNGSEVIFAGSAEPLKLQMLHFIECLITRACPISHGEQGWTIVALMETIMQKLAVQQETSHAK